MKVENKSAKKVALAANVPAGTVCLYGNEVIMRCTIDDHSGMTGFVRLDGERHANGVGVMTWIPRTTEVLMMPDADLVLP